MRPEQNAQLEILSLLTALTVENARTSERLERQARELAAALADLEAARERLLHGERLAAIGAVVARVSHEIRNPLATIGGFARILDAQPVDAGLPGYASIIVQEVEKLELLLREMLDFTGPRAPHLEPVDLNALVRDLARIHQSDLARHGVDLVLALGDLPPVDADRTQVERVLLNLWQNAAQAIAGARPAGRGTVTVTTGGGAGGVVLAVADDGPGIRPEDLPHLFTPFFTRKRHGTGLGLAVVKRIIDDHHGQIDVRDTTGGGMTFVVRLPPTRMR